MLVAIFIIGLPRCRLTSGSGLTVVNPLRRRLRCDRCPTGYRGEVGEVLVGTASWTDKTLLESGWYPENARTAEERLAYYASRFPLVEVDSTYYAPPAERTVEAWRDRTPAGFTFNVKAFSLLTHHPTKPGALYKD